MRHPLLKSWSSFFPAARRLVISCGASQVTCGTFKAGPDGQLVLQQFARKTIDAAPMSAERWSESVAAALTAMASQEKMRGLCRCALSGQHTLVKWVRTPSVDPMRRESAAAFEAQQGIPCPLDQVVWDHSFVGDDGLDLEMVVAAVKRDFIENFCNLTRTAGFRAAHIVPSSLGMPRAFRHNYPEVQENVLLLHVGARTTHLVFLEGERYFVRTLRLGGNTVTQAIADDLKIEFARAEAWKLQMFSGEDGEIASFVRCAVKSAASRFALLLHAELVRSILHARRRNGTGQSVALYLAGGGSLVPGLAAILTDKLKLPAERFEPLRRVELSFALDPTKVAAAAPFLVDLVGLALHEEGTSHLNLLPPSFMEEMAFRRRRPVLLATAAMATAAFLPLAGHYRQRAARAEEKTAFLEQRLQPLRALAARNADNLVRLAEGNTQLTTLRQLVAAKSAWMTFISDLQRRLESVEDVWLEKFRWMPVAPADGAPDLPAASRQLALSGCLLDRNNPISKVSQDSYARVKNLQRLLGESPFVIGVENERFDASEPGLLRFDFTLVLKEEAPL